MRTLRALTPPTAPPAGFLSGSAYAGARMLWPVCPAAGAVRIGRGRRADEKQVRSSRGARCFAVRRLAPVFHSRSLAYAGAGVPPVADVLTRSGAAVRLPGGGAQAIFGRDLRPADVPRVSCAISR